MPAIPDGGGSLTPAWFTPPDPAGRTDVFSMAAGQGVRVQPDALKTFASSTNGEAMAFHGNVTAGISSLMQLAAGIGAGTQASAHFADVHGTRVQELMHFAQDVGVGLMALSTGATTIAVQYVDADSTQAATLQQVQGAFAPAAGQTSLRGEMDRAAAEQAQVTAEDQEVVDGIAAKLQLPEATDLTPDAAAPAGPVDPRAGEQTVPLGDSGETYTVPRTYDMEGLDVGETMREMGADVARGDGYQAPQPEDD